MNRLIVLLLAAVDAAIAVAVGMAATLAPLTMLWVFVMPGADWAALWPATSSIWQFAMLVPLSIHLPVEYVTALGIDAQAASFALSLAPLALAAFVAIFAARSGVRASQAEAWITGVCSGTLVFAVLAAGIAVTSANDIARVEFWHAVLFPTLVFAVPATAGAFVTEWREAGNGPIASLRDRCAKAGEEWAATPALMVRGSAVVVTGLIGAGAILTAIALAVNASEIVALYQSSNVDALGAVMFTIAQLGYLPTLIVWALSFIAGPGVALGAGSVVAPAGTTAGIIPAVPLLGALPSDTSPWLLLLALVPVALGAGAGWIARSHLAQLRRPDYSLQRLTGEHPHDKMAPRLAIAGGIAVLSAGVSALLAWLASGAFGPGRLAQLGPEPGPVALAIGLEVALGASILLLSPRSEHTADQRDHRDDEPANATPTEDQLTAPLDL